jgi:hypothetical protein
MEYRGLDVSGLGQEKLSESCEHCTELDIQRTVHRDIFL